MWRSGAAAASRKRSKGLHRFPSADLNHCISLRWAHLRCHLLRVTAGHTPTQTKSTYSCEKQPSLELHQEVKLPNQTRCARRGNGRRLSTLHQAPFTKTGILTHRHFNLLSFVSLWCFNSEFRCWFKERSLDCGGSDSSSGFESGPAGSSVFAQV